MTLANFVYARVRTLDQNLSLELDALAAVGCDKVFEDHASGARADHARQRAALDYVRDSEVLAVWNSTGSATRYPTGSKLSRT